MVGLLAAPAFAWDGSRSSPIESFSVQQADYPSESTESADDQLQQCAVLVPNEEPSDSFSLYSNYDLGCQEEGCRGCNRCKQRGSSLDLGGWISAGIYANAHGTALNGPLGTNQFGDGPNLHQAWLYAEKAVNTGGCGFDWGYRIDALFGLDAQDTQAFGGQGWDNDWDTSARYGFALPQLYAAFGYNNLTVKAGHFYTPIGYETMPAPENFFYSHSYTFYYGEPLTHTGILASYDWNDNVTFHAGWTLGWDTGFDNTPGGNTFLGGVNWRMNDTMDLTWLCSAGTLGTVLGDVYMNSFVYQWAFAERWTYILQHDLGTVSNVAGDATWYGINQYLVWDISQCWAAAVRTEWFCDDDGARINYNGPANGCYFGVTAGVNWKPRERLIVRPEVRYDTFDGAVAAGAAPFNDGTSISQLSGGVDVIWTF